MKKEEEEEEEEKEEGEEEEEEEECVDELIKEATVNVMSVGRKTDSTSIV